MNYQPDIITTIESTARDFIQKNKKLPTFVSLSNEEFEAYIEERRSGRYPKIRHKRKEIILSVRRFS